MNIRKLVLLLLLVGVIFSSLGVQAFAAEVGDQLTEPESGWKRYDDSDSNITYEGQFTTANIASLYNGSWKWGWCNDQKIKFSFSGSKLRLYSFIDGNKTSNISILIDGVEETFSEAVGSGYQTLVYEKNDLGSGNHNVEIAFPQNSGKNAGLDAIDIDENGELGPYNEVNNDSVLYIEPEKEKIEVSETVIANLVIDNISEIVAEDIKIDYDETKLEYLGFEELDEMKLVKLIDETSDGKLRVIIASKGEANIVSDKKVLLKLKFRGIASGVALVDVTNGRVTDGIEMEKDLTDEECGQGQIIIEEVVQVVEDVNKNGEFTLLDLGIDARHFSKDPSATELANYNTDIVVNNAIDDADLLEIARLILENTNYTPNN